MSARAQGSCCPEDVCESLGADLLRWGPSDHVAGEVSLLLASAWIHRPPLCMLWTAARQRCSGVFTAPGQQGLLRQLCRSHGGDGDGEEMGMNSWCQVKLTDKLEVYANSFLDSQNSKEGHIKVLYLSIYGVQNHGFLCVCTLQLVRPGRCLFSAINSYLCNYKQPSS